MAFPEIHVHNHTEHDLCEVYRMLREIITNQEKIMSKISEFADRVDARLTDVKTFVEGIAGDIATLKTQIAALQASVGEVTPEDQARIDTIEQTINGLADRTKNIDDLTAPVTPPSP